ncbi:hypothetical protein ILYODFUR_035800 [Ilyodon furcidens]|uniref:Uncharacterized protein n=1 Tax=Ilyodon furcidens TaxID=33524 RepID=A0ABV0TDW5_9TELE
MLLCSYSFWHTYLSKAVLLPVVVHILVCVCVCVCVFDILNACVFKGLSLVFGQRYALLFSFLCQHLYTAPYHVFHWPILLILYVCMSFVQLHKLISAISPAVVL